MEGGVFIMRFLFLFSLVILLHNVDKIYAAELNTITYSSHLTNGDTLVSPRGIFELGFFRPNSETKFLGIWYKNMSVQIVVWVANREYPRPKSSVDVLRISDKGDLVLIRDTTNETIWSSSNTNTGSRNTTAKLLDTGNLVVMDDTDSKVLWQSFDNPTDTLLPGMKLGEDYEKKIEWILSSWKTSQDPAPGDFTWGVDRGNYPQNILKKNGVKIFRAGPWRKERLVGNFNFTFNIVISEKEVSLTFNLENNTIPSRVILNSTGQLESFMWAEDARKWLPTVSLPRDICDTYNTCNAYGSCSVNTTTNKPSCACMDEKRFVPEYEENWETPTGWTDGCVRRTSLNCHSNGQSDDGFTNYTNVKLPDTQSSWFNTSMTMEECRTHCLKNCSCMAYANIESSGAGCLIWVNDLMDIRVFPEGSGSGRDIFVRMASSELVISKEKRGANVRAILLIIFAVVLVIALISTWCIYAWIKRKGGLWNAYERHDEAMELPLLSFTTIANATARFSLDNKLGEGGFGTVFKGHLDEGIEIAVKRLSKSSSQGVNEFKNEVICVSKLQHRNLVKLLGCCIKGNEKLLVYEYMPNGSLDSFIFDKRKGMLLDWTKRFNIIMGIARGLVYLHRDSRLRIIHRDLKASNILLDEDMNPKISDFGVARSFGGNETQANTERVVGTYGYMSPEYALEGVFSIKSDVFSFGVLVLEILIGKRNRGLIQPENENNLIGHAWLLYKEGRLMELIDPTLVESCRPPEVLRSIEVGLLCVQHSPEERPNMSNVIRMLAGEGAVPQPKEPAFFTEKDDHWLVGEFSSSTNCGASTINHVPITKSIRQ
uniref:G-type lectin S-receptor-like serine/threonine-protein kinase At4g27290 n=1 Tax=Erigeron canadensis TaxID=72917 RepID=UPI001CB99390|nr:G-type lectin S-receptor-like serine/threonine-protein kinase At4g27290 [Erigeron canadensis]